MEMNVDESEHSASAAAKPLQVSTPGAIFSKRLRKISFPKKGCAYLRLLWKTSLEDLTSNIFTARLWERMRIVETSLEGSLEKSKKICKKALTLSYERKLHNANEIVH